MGGERAALQAKARMDELQAMKILIQLQGEIA